MIDNLWLLISALFVFCMQAGFLCLESGRTRSKNNINVAAKNIIDFILSAAIFWLIGFGFMFGDSFMGVIGFSEFVFNNDHSSFEFSFFLFQLMFCGTAATLTSGAVAERMTFIGYTYITVILSTIIYPIVGHWTWASLFNNANTGWLESIGFIDFAGSTVVHSVGGWVALAAILVIGPRTGRFNKDRSFPSGSNIPMAAFGVLLIWFGWFGFNGGSTLTFDDSVPKILLNTMLAAVWGGLAATIIGYYRKNYFNISVTLNGVIAGLVSVTAACNIVVPADAAIIAIIGSIIMYCGSLWLEKLEIDDALGVVPAHLFAGIWGTLAVALFGEIELPFGEQLFTQFIGIVVIGFYSFVVSYILFKTINLYSPLRTSLDNENKGLNITEHKASTELIDLLSDMENQQDKGDFTTPVKEEPFTEVGQIAKKYNQVIDRVTREMTSRDNAIVQFKASEKRKISILESSMDCIISIDWQGLIIEFNPSAERTLGVLKKRVEGENFVDLFVLNKDKQRVIDSIQHAFTAAKGLILNRRSKIEIKRATGEAFPAEITITSAKLGSKSQTEYTLHIRDVAKDLKLQSRLQFLAYKDPLTGLSNRAHMMKELFIAIKLAQEKQLDVALYFLDLDKFKKINDTLGHKAGDKLLCEVANRLNDISRDNDIISRWGGDEFIFIITGMLDDTVITQKANQLLDQMRIPIALNNKGYEIQTSIGVAISSKGIISADDLIQYADIAMYKAKASGRDTYKVYDSCMGKEAAKVLNYEHEIKQAIEQNQFKLVYQPKVKENSENVIGLEALIRWDHPDKGEIFPSDFIPIAEESHLIIELGEYVIKTAIRQQRQWLSEGLSIVPLSVNISEKHILSENFLLFLSQQLQEENIEGKWLDIEITEHVLIHDIEECICVLSSIKELGVTISIDDFGTGYSSLSYLKRLPIDTLKIDRSFVQECSDVDEDREICSAIVNLASMMGLSVVAEGVETESQASTLISLGCNVFQGYYFYKPLPLIKVSNLLIQS
jgi:Amt family ammonium transporter